MSMPYWRRIETAAPINDFALNRLARRCLCNTLGRTLRDWPRIAARFPPPVLAPRLSSTSLARASPQPCARSLAQQRAVPLSASSRSAPVVGWPQGPIADDHHSAVDRGHLMACGLVIELVSRAALVISELRPYFSRIRPASGQATRCCCHGD